MTQEGIGKHYIDNWLIQMQRIKKNQIDKFEKQWVSTHRLWDTSDLNIKKITIPDYIKIILQSKFITSTDMLNRVLQQEELSRLEQSEFNRNHQGENTITASILYIYKVLKETLLQ